MAQARDPSNNCVEFVQVWGGILNEYLEGVVMYDSRNGSKYILRHLSNSFTAVFFNKHCLIPS